MAERKSIKLYFASPNISNTEIFLELFDKSTDESMVIKETPVSQNRFFVDFVDKKEIMFLENGVEDLIEPFGGYSDFNDLLNKIGRGNKNIIYCNSIEDTINYALSFSKTLEDKNEKIIDDTIELIQSYLHKEYYLIDCLRKGVAFHFGKLPQRIREKIENLYEKKIIDYMFCTSTLLEGVNLPAQNIFILNNTIGTSKFTDIDFWNLAGRAGRLNKDLSGNVICVRLDENKWKSIEQGYEMISRKEIQPVSPTIMTGEKNFYKNLENSILGKPFTKKDVTQNECEIWNHYANIVYYQEISKADSLLKSNFMKKNNATAKQVLEYIEKNNVVPERVLEQSTNIKPVYQNMIWNSLEKSERAFSKEISQESCYKMLYKMYDKYKWGIEESKGRKPLIRDKEQLKYYATLMYSWVSSNPLHMIVNNIIQYHNRKGYIYHQRERISFNKSNRDHLNWIINDLVSDIENCLRYKIKYYFNNYYMIVSEKNGKDTAGDNWAEFLEYGTTDREIIDLQNIGLPRHMAVFIRNKFHGFLEYDGVELVNINISKIVELLKSENYNQDVSEMIKLLERKRIMC